MNRNTLIAGLTLMLSLPLSAADKPKTVAAAKDQTLAAGSYSATVKAIVCEGCAQFITETLKKNPALETISVDPKAKTVSFTVKKSATVKVSELQKALKLSAAEMGMGADYSLSDIKSAK